MCGIAGLITPLERGPRETVRRVEAMTACLAHRGPDDEGVFVDPERRRSCVLGHKRLAIIDIGRGKQPMTTADGRLTVVFNGAIYNYPDLRRELIGLGHHFETYSDTEVLLHAYSQWGDDFLNNLNGMFAFAIWDAHERELLAARDRFGIKPFYYHLGDEALVFASEIKAVLASGLLGAEPDPYGLRDYLTFQYCLGAKTMFKNIQRLEPGTLLRCRQERGRLTCRVRRWWDLAFDQGPSYTEEQAVDYLKTLLEDSVRVRFISDVPVGAALSGGMDSSTVVAISGRLLQRTDLKTFSGGFREGDEGQFDETRYARLVAQQTGCRNYAI